MNIGEYVKKKRNDRGITLRKLEEMTDISNAYISQIENQNKIPTEQLIERLANGLGETDLQKVVIKNELLELAGYKIQPLEPGEDGYDDYIASIRDNFYEGELSKKDLQIEELKFNVDLDKVLDDDVKFMFLNKELTEDERTILKYTLATIRDIRK